MTGLLYCRRSDRPSGVPLFVSKVRIIPDDTPFGVEQSFCGTDAAVVHVQLSWFSFSLFGLLEARMRWEGAPH
jgi:hypothetical protein